MLIGDATAVYYDGINISRVYAGSKLVFGQRNFLTSRNVTSAAGYTVGDPVDKTTSTANYKTLANYLPGDNDYTATRRYWTDWGDDIFDSWGMFYLYDPQLDAYNTVNLPFMEESDGVISTATITAFGGRVFTIKYGYPVQGIFKFDISVNDNSKTFIFGMDGNLGSNGSTFNQAKSQAYTLGGENLILHYNYNVQQTIPTEVFYTYVVPYETSQNKSTLSYFRYIYNTDNLSLYTRPVTKGVTVYVAKHNDVKDWVINDLQLVEL